MPLLPMSDDGQDALSIGDQQASISTHVDATDRPATADDWGDDESPTLRVPRVSFEEAPTRLRLRAVSRRSSSPMSGVMDYWAVDELPTMILPAISAQPITVAAMEAQADVPVGVGGYIAPLRGLIKSSGIYALASMASPVVSLGLAPFLTHHLTPADYGILTILNTSISLTAGVTQLGLNSAFFRAYNYDYTSESDKRDVIATVVVLLCLVSIPMVLGVTLSAPFLADLLFGRSSFGGFVALAAGAIFLQNLTVPGFAWLRAENRAFFFALLSILSLLVTLGANLVLIGLVHLGVAGSLIATGSGYASVVMCTAPLIIRRAGVKMRIDIAGSLLAFGVPQVPNVISVWVLQLSDRYLLSIFGSLAQTASYAVAYTLGTALSIVVISPFSLAWPTTMYMIAKREDAAQVFKLVFRWFSILLFFAAFALSLAGIMLLYRLFPLSYHSAAPVVPIVALSVACYGVYIFLTVGISIRRKTWLASLLTTIAALTNFILNLFLIPRYGAMGAAASTLIAYAGLAVMAFVVNQRIYPVPFEVGRLLNVLFAGLAFYIGGNVLARLWGQWVWPIDVLSLLFYGIWLFFWGNGMDLIRLVRR